MNARVGIIGAGAIGGWVAAKLALGGSRVSILARGETHDAIKRDGLILREQGEDHIATLPCPRMPPRLGPRTSS